jgi:hypothetical protein
MAYKPYRPRGVSPRLQDVMERLAPTPTKQHKPCTYSSSDILRAKTVLDRLLALPERNEVVSITDVVEELDEE